jgi:phosphate transport system substrate-binding protein
MLKNTVMALIGAAFVTTATAAEITGAGATFPYPIYAKWADSYKKETGNTVNYQSIGSGAGIKQITAKTVTFGATDMPLTKEELDKNGFAQFPTVIGGVVPVINVAGIEPGQLTLTGEVLADIYLSKIAKWNDPRIAALNPGAKLPDAAITKVRRADGSGTTFIFTHYLSQASKAWEKEIGEGPSVEWNGNAIGAKGNEGVAGNVQQANGSIGYVEYVYAKQNRMTWVKLINPAGRAVSPNTESFQAAAAGADFDPAKGFYAILTSSPRPEAWPISGATFILMYKDPADKALSKEALKFFEYAYKNSKMAEELDFVPLPAALVDNIKSSWKDIK